MGRSHHMQRKTRITEVDRIISTVRANRKDIRDFFKRDQSFVLSKFPLNPQDHNPIRIALLSTVDGEESLEVQLRRLLASRHLALKREASPYGSDIEFLRGLGLGSDAVNGLHHGQRNRRIEKGVGVDGISLETLSCSTLLLHLRRDGESVLIETFNNTDSAEYLQEARAFTPLLHLYQRGFDEDVAFYNSL